MMMKVMMMISDNDSYDDDGYGNDGSGDDDNDDDSEDYSDDDNNDVDDDDINPCKAPPCQLCFIKTETYCVNTWLPSALKHETISSPIIYNHVSLITSNHIVVSKMQRLYHPLVYIYQHSIILKKKM